MLTLSRIDGYCYSFDTCVWSSLVVVFQIIIIIIFLVRVGNIMSYDIMLCNTVPKNNFLGSLLFAETNLSWDLISFIVLKTIYCKFPNKLI